MEVSLRRSIDADLETFFHHQTDEEANYLAAFTPKNPNDKLAYLDKWRKLMQDNAVNMQTILLSDKVVGHVVKFVMEGDSEITYAIGKEYWGQGITTQAVKQFLQDEQTRPIYARAAYDNFGSQRVLEKVGFERMGKDRGFAHARGREIEEFIYKLERKPDPLA